MKSFVSKITNLSKCTIPHGAEMRKEAAALKPFYPAESLVGQYLDMVEVTGSSPVSPTNNLAGFLNVNKFGNFITNEVFGVERITDGASLALSRR